MIEGLQKLQEIRSLVIIALFSDDELMDMFVLKGGNAINLVYGLNTRASIDIDISMETDFEWDTISSIKDRLEQALTITFSEKKLYVFDVKLTPRPLGISSEFKKYWGGYRLEFKVIDTVKHNELNGNIDSIRRNAIVIGENQQRTFKVDISKYEYCREKEAIDFNGYTIYVYSPIMVILEKLRAICQQMDEYKSIIPTATPRKRARDFFDIYYIKQHWDTPIDLASNFDTLKAIFEIKKVPLNFLDKIGDYREFHRDDFNTVRDTVDSQYPLESYDFYFDYVLKLVAELEFHGII